RKGFIRKTWLCNLGELIGCAYVMLSPARLVFSLVACERATASNISNQYPHKGSQYATCESNFNNEYANRIHQDEFAAHRVEAIKPANNRWQSEQIIFGHL